MYTIPEDLTAPVDDPKSIDGILARLSEIERRLDERADDELRKKVLRMEMSFKGISKDVLKHQEALIPVVEKEISHLSTYMEQRMTRIREELVQITDQVANCSASSIEQLIWDIAHVAKRVKKLENLQPDASLKSDGAFADVAEAVSKDSTGGQDVIDNVSTTGGSVGDVGSQILHSANTKSADSADVTQKSSTMSDDSVSRNSSDAGITLECKLDGTSSSQEQFARVGDEKGIGCCSVSAPVQQDVAASQEAWPASAAVERQVTGADWLPRSTGSLICWTTPNRTRMARSCSPPASSPFDVSWKSIQLTSKEGPLRLGTKDPLTAIPASPPTRNRCVGTLRFPLMDVDHLSSLNAAKHSPARTRASSLDRRAQRMSICFGSRSGPRDASPGLSSTPGLMPQQTKVYGI